MSQTPTLLELLEAIEIAEDHGILCASNGTLVGAEKKPCDCYLSKLAEIRAAIEYDRELVMDYLSVFYLYRSALKGMKPFDVVHKVGVQSLVVAAIRSAAELYEIFKARTPLLSANGSGSTTGP